MIDSDGLAVLIAHGDGTLEAQRRVDSGSVIAVAVADLNGDRIKDLAALRTDDSFLHIFPGSGDGNFGAPFSVPFVMNGGDLLVRDLNGDGQPDLAATDPTGSTVWVWICGRGGNLGAPRVYPIPTQPDRLLAGDIDGDGRPELLVLHRYQAGFTSLANDGLGNFASPTLHVAPSGSSLAATGDVNGDGRADLIIPEGDVYDQPYALNTWYGRPDGSFDSPVRVETGVLAEGLAVGDLDADGAEDVIVIRSRAFLVHKGSPSGLGPAGPPRFLSPVGAPAALGNFDGDRLLDLCVPEWSATGGILECPLYSGSTLFVLKGLGDGGFAQLAGLVAIAKAENVETTDGSTCRTRSRVFACRLVEDQPDGRPDLELEFSAGDVLAGWLASREFLRRDPPEAETVLLPFEGRLRDGSRISGHACALIVGRPEVRDARAIATLSAFGPLPGRDYGVGVVPDLPAPAASADVTIYDVAGRHVAELHRGGLDAGSHRLTWSGGPGSIAGPTSGIYFARAMVDGERLRARVLVLR